MPLMSCLPTWQAPLIDSLPYSIQSPLPFFSGVASAWLGRESWRGSVFWGGRRRWHQSEIKGGAGAYRVGGTEQLT